jgi:hypothetical protein
MPPMASLAAAAAAASALAPTAMTAGTAATDGLRSLRSLLRAILRMHRRQLPGDMRALGDATVRAEFRAHAARPPTGPTAVTPQQWAEFAAQWRGYLALLQPNSLPTPGPDTFSVPDSEAASAALSNEELQQQRCTPALGSGAAAAGSGGDNVASAGVGGDGGVDVDSVRQMMEGLDGYLSAEQRLRVEGLRKEAGQLGRAMLGLITPAEAAAAAEGAAEGADGSATAGMELPPEPQQRL